MKIQILLAALLMSLGAFAQNQISTPSQKPLKINSDTLRLSSGYLKLNDASLISVKSTSGGQNLSVGVNSGNYIITGKSNTSLGDSTGNALTSGYENTFLGFTTGKINTYGRENTFIGANVGKKNTGGHYNVFVGSQSGKANVTGGNNIFIGRESGGANTVGNNNIYLGYQSGAAGIDAENNVIIGHQAGRSYAGSGNVFIGFKAGSNSAGTPTGAAVDNKLIITNRTIDGKPLIEGDFANGSNPSRLILYGKTGVTSSTSTFVFPATTYGTYSLFVKGGILAEAVTVSTTWADYVFDKEYKLKPLSEVEKYIQANKHLPNIPAAAEIESAGMNVGEMSRLQQEKIEELTLYLIEQQKVATAQQKEIDELKVLVKTLVESRK
ncbi:hypothetical protein [Dyadobacter sp. Leaf189]|uniref:hypothetical protein n=1 Tax=Dyadobacter sp. Leaf189 TaxID=1736295 RepID=UPI0006F2E727|nr:hypothetical protein [Dyadobacter sp. Leaf189]KQS27911.1 hypothetical protein ASG33_15990 [Dyadobacter sp. Leaf189]